MSRKQNAHDRIRHEARAVGLSQVELPSLEAVERRRLQLWLTTAFLLIGIGGVIALVSYRTGLTDADLWLSPTATRFSIFVLAIGFSAYAIEKELHLRRLTRLLVEERVLSASLTNRLNVVTALLDAGRAMNSVLELDQVLDMILRSALDLLHGAGGSVMLVEGEDRLRAVCVHGNDDARDRVVGFGEGIAGRVAVSGEPLLLSGNVRAQFRPPIERAKKVDSAMSVPLVNREELLGVLNVNASSDRTFNEYDLRALSLFAEQAAVAIANARLYESQRAYVDELLELDRMKSEFVASVSHDLRTPLTAIIGAAAMAKRHELPPAKREDLVDGISRQAHRLADMIEEMLLAKGLQHPERAPRLERVDVAGLARTTVEDYELAGRPAVYEGPEVCRVIGDPELLNRIFGNLLDNAFKYGAPPVRVLVEPNGDTVVVGVLDSGAGIPPQDRERVFERFQRLDVSRTGPGIGLGLAIVRTLAAVCGGRAWVEEAPGGGAAFRVALPAAAPASESAAV